MNGQRQEQITRLETLEPQIKEQHQVLEYLQRENLQLKDRNVELEERMRRIEEARSESDAAMDHLFQDEQFLVTLKARLAALQTKS